MMGDSYILKQILLQHVSSRSKIVFSALLVFLMACSAPEKQEEDEVAEPAWTDGYQKGLIYEKDFRDLSYLAFKKYAHDTKDIYEKKAWGVFVKLEEHSIYRMQPFREKYKLKTEASLKTKISARIIAVAINLMPKTVFGFLEGSARRFVAQLEAIKALGPPEDQSTLAFMVNHEQTLVYFLEYYNRGDREKALDVFLDKLGEYYPSGYPNHAPRPNETN